ncbi:DUF5801 repeats-in-toxin domain-containing protein [Pelagibius marinus]|uniref:DUF5801 repeats-in-toxin domain-containing protein n=1 Tax=Pelagibius marinus TaxID=2762760 RepID=UPI00187265E0|nr:hypothetical protein [Pelagibius marinus]
MTEDLKQVSGEPETGAESEAMDNPAAQTVDDSAVEGSAGADFVVGEAPLVITPPAAGQTEVVQVDPGASFELAADPGAVQLVVDGNNLIVGFDLDGDGEPDSFVIFEDMLLVAGGGNPPVMTVAGELIDMDLLLAAGSAGSESLVGQSLRVITPPQAGETEVVRLEPGERFELAANPATVQLVVDGNNLVMGFDLDGDGEPDSFVIFEDMVLAAGSGNPPVLMVAGEPIGMDLLLSNAVALAQAEQAGGPGATPLETAVGDVATGGGNNVYNDNLGDAIELLIAQGVIPPTELEFGLIELEDEIVLLEEEPAPPPPPSVPPTTFTFDETPGAGTGTEGSDGFVGDDQQGLGDIFIDFGYFPQTGSGVPDEIHSIQVFSVAEIAAFANMGITIPAQKTGEALHQIQVSGVTSAELQYTTGDPVLTSGGDPVTSEGEQVYYLVDPTNPNLVLGVTGLVVFGEGEFEYDNLVFGIFLDDNFTFGSDTLFLSFVGFEQIDHPDPTDDDESIALDINFDVTGAGGTSSTSAILLIEDDAPDADGGEGGTDDMLLYDETPGLQTGEETNDPLPSDVNDVVVSEELTVCGAALDTITFDYGMDQPVEGGEAGPAVGGVALTQADGSAYTGQDSGLDTLDGVDILLYSDGDNMVRGEAAGELIFIVYLDDSNAFTFFGPDNEASADIWFVQFDAFFHPDDTDPNDQIDFPVYYTVTDYDQDTDTQEFLIKILDDGPAIYGGTSEGVVEEEHLPVVGNEDTTPGGDQDTLIDFDLTTTVATGDLSLLIVPGKDAPALFGFASDTTPLDDQNLTSGGQALSYDFTSGGVLVGFVGVFNELDDSNWVFTLELQEEGDWTFELLAKLDHHAIPDADNDEGNKTIDFTGMVEATDSDFDPVTLDPETFLVKVIDDIPIANDDDDTAEIGGDPVEGNVLDGTEVNPGDDAGGDPDASEVDFAGADGLGVIRSVTHDGVTYELNEAGDDIVGSPAGLVSFVGGVLTIDTAEGGTLAITMTGSDIGDYTYTPPESAASSSEAFDYVLEDGDGDGDEATLTINLDDAPSAQAPAQKTHDESDGLQGGSDNVTATEDDDDDDIAAPGGLVSDAETAAGLGGGSLAAIGAIEQSLTFDVGLDDSSFVISYDTAVDATTTGLVMTETGKDVYFYVDPSSNGDLVLGVTLDDSVNLADGIQTGEIEDVVFSLHLTNESVGAGDDSATSTFIQYEAVVSPTPGTDADHDEPLSTPLTIDYIVEDEDGQQDSAEIAIQIEDDGPSITSDGDVEVDEEDLDTTADVAVAFTIDYGNDGGDIDDVALISTDDGDDGGSLTLETTDGTDVLTFYDSTTQTLIGYVDGGDPNTPADQVFTLEINDNGTGTFTLLQSLNHPDVDETGSADPLDLTFRVTVIDGDDDTDTADIVVTVNDDGPTVEDASVSGTVEEEHLPGGNEDTTPGADQDTLVNFDLTEDSVSGSLSSLVDFGEDGPGGFSLQVIENGTDLPVDSGFNSIGEDIVLVSDGSTLTGFVDSGDTANELDVNDRKVFELSVSGTNYTFLLFDQMDHLADDLEDIIELDFSSYLIASDGDDDTTGFVEDTFVINVIDDIPENIDPEDGLVANSSSGFFVGDLDLAANVGADEEGDVVFNVGLDGTLLEDASNTQLFTQDGDLAITLLVLDDGHRLLATTNPGDPSDTGAWVFEAVLEPGTDSYSITMYQAIDDGSGVTFEDFSDAPAGNNSWVGIDDPRSGTPEDENEDLLFTGLQPDEDGVDPDTVNTSNFGVGTNSQSIGVGDGLRLDYVSNINIVGGDPKVLDTLTYDGHYTVNDASFSIIQTGGNASNTVDTQISVFDADDDQGNAWNTADDPKDDITRIIVFDETDTEVDTWIFADGDSGSTTDGITVTWDGGTLAGDVLVEGLLVGYEVFVTTDDGFNRMEILNVTSGGEANDTFDLGGFEIDSQVSGSPIDLTFDLDVEDEDGDTSDGQLDFTVLPELNGSALGDELVSNGDPEVLVGGGGDDTLTGGAGGDIFVYSLAADEGTDQILDFTLSEGDALSFVDVTDIEPDLDIDVDDVISNFVDGGGAGTVDTITLTSGTVIELTDVDGAFTSADDVFNNSMINGA